MRDGRAIRRDLDELFVGGVKRAIGNVSQCNIGRIIDRQVEPGGDVRHGTTTLAQAFAVLLGYGPVGTLRVRDRFV